MAFPTSLEVSTELRLLPGGLTLDGNTLSEYLQASIESLGYKVTARGTGSFEFRSTWRLTFRRYARSLPPVQIGSLEVEQQPNGLQVRARVELQWLPLTAVFLPIGILTAVGMQAAGPLFPLLGGFLVSALISGSKYHEWRTGFRAWLTECVATAPRRSTIDGAV